MFSHVISKNQLIFSDSSLLKKSKIFPHDTKMFILTSHLVLLFIYLNEKIAIIRITN